MKSIKIALTSMFLILSSYASAVEISSNVGLSSDYIWRGMSQTAGDLSVNGGFDLSTDNGSSWGNYRSRCYANSHLDNRAQNGANMAFLDITNTSTHKFKVGQYQANGTTVKGNTSTQYTYIFVKKIGDT